jgi:hypothetical protein
VGVDRTLPREEFFYRQLVSSADSLKAYHASRTALTIAALRRVTQRFVSGGGRSQSRYSALARCNEDEDSSDMRDLLTESFG